MKFVELVPVLPARCLEEVIICFIPASNCCKPRAGNSGQRMKIEAIDNK
jgi:hypothetical protein